MSTAEASTAARRAEDFERQRRHAYGKPAVELLQLRARLRLVRHLVKAGVLEEDAAAACAENAEAAGRALYGLDSTGRELPYTYLPAEAVAPAEHRRMIRLAAGARLVASAERLAGLPVVPQLYARADRVRAAWNEGAPRGPHDRDPDALLREARLHLDTVQSRTEIRTRPGLEKTIGLLRAAEQHLVAAEHLVSGREHV